MSARPGSIGLALAKEFAKRGSHVTIVARTKSKLEDAVADISKLCTSADQVSPPPRVGMPAGMPTTTAAPTVAPAAH